MVSVKQHLFKVWDESGTVKTDVFLSEGDLVMIYRKNVWPSENPPSGIFRGVKENADGSQSYVLLEIPDKIGCYDMPSLQTKVIEFNVKEVDHIQFLARNSLAVSILFKQIGTLLAIIADLKARVEKAMEALNSQ